MSAGRLWLPEASEALPLGWLVLSWRWEGLEGNLVQPAPWALHPQGVSPRQVFQDGELAFRPEIGILVA